MKTLSQELKTSRYLKTIVILIAIKMSYNSNSYAFNSTSTMNIIPFQIRFENCLKDPIVSKCQTLNQLIHESIANNLKDIQINFISLVEDIFGLGRHSMATDWSLKLISRNFNPREFDSVYGFLHTNGPLFQLIRQLMNDPLNRYDFPKSYLPTPTKLSLEEGVIPSLYANKLSHILSSTISLNAFEFFLFHFCYHILNNNTSAPYVQQNPFYFEQLNNANTNPSNIVFYALFENYLYTFIPLSSEQTVLTQSPSNQSSLWQSLSSTTSSLLHLGTAANSVSPKQMSSTPQTSSLFKTSLLNLKPLLSGGQEHQNREQMFHRSIHDSLGTEISKCETFLSIVTELWLNHSVPHTLAQRHHNSPSKQQLFTPNSGHMRAVRILVKHLHYFANSCAKRGNESINLINSSPLDDMKRSVWSQKYLFQKKLYTFFRLSFDRWPNDTSFRLPLEAWLSYIQPWRYTNASFTPTSPTIDELSRPEVSLNDQKWKQFISDNLLFYSVIFRQLIPRFSRVLDLNSSKNALMLFRLTKVFSQPNLSLWIREVEDSLTNCETSAANILQTNWSTNSRANLLSPTIRQQNISSFGGNMRHPLMELESNTFEYIPLFCPAIKPLILQLLIEISKALNSVNQIIDSIQASDETLSGVSFIQFIISFFKISEEMTKTDENKRVFIDKTKTKNHLESASIQLSQLFEIPAPDSDLISAQNQTFDENTPFNQNKPLFETRDGTPKLTAFGRKQVLNRVCKPEFNNLIEGNPDRQPVRSFEFYYLVHILLWINDWINGRYGLKIENLYNREGFVGLFFRQLFSAPVAYIRLVKSADAYRPPERVTEVLTGRVNLRFIANKVFLFYSTLLLSIVWCLNYSLISFSCLLIAMYFTYLSTKTLLIHFSSH